MKNKTNHTQRNLGGEINKMEETIELSIYLSEYEIDSLRKGLAITSITKADNKKVVCIVNLKKVFR